MFENSVPGLPEKASAEGLEPLAYMRKYGCVEISTDEYAQHESEVPLDQDVEVRGKEQVATKTSYDPDHCC